jgi:Hemerythrin HHE cation binding domain
MQAQITTEPDRAGPDGAGERVDLYREIHKGLRLALFELTRVAGALDAADPASVQDFAELFADVDTMLATHHGHEDGEQLGDLIRRHATDAAPLVADGHDESGRRLAGIRSLTGELVAGVDVGGELYRAVATFTARYLDHMLVEETEVMPALQRAVPPEELLALLMAIRASVPQPLMCVFLRYMLPAMTPDERTATLGGMKAGAPPEVFEAFWAVAEASLAPADLAVVAGRIAG